jgi:hypothetical protein
MIEGTMIEGTMNETTPGEIQCDGWWEQREFGRQLMLKLRISFHQGQIQGSGVDLIGPFTLSGRMGLGGGVVINKQYIGRHRVEYVGTYDGEGTLAGQWQLVGCQGAWLITLGRGRPRPSAQIQEMFPAND